MPAIKYVKVQSLPRVDDPILNRALHTIDGELSKIARVLNYINTDNIPDDAITSDKIFDGAVLNQKLYDACITANKIADEAITEAKIAALAVSEAKIAVAAITEAKVAADAITTEKIANATITASLIGDAYKILEIVDSLPDVGTAGRIVYLTTDNKIYRDNGTAWVELIMPGDVYKHLGGIDIPTIDTEAIANAAIETAKIANLAVETGKLAANAVTTTKLVKAAQAYNSDIIFLPGDSGNENKHNAVHWVAGHIAFADGTIQDINAGQVIGLGNGVTRYIYFEVGDAVLKNTSEYAAVISETTRLLATVIVSNDNSQEIAILYNQNTSGNFIADLIAPGAITNTELGNFCVAVNNTNFTAHQIY